MKTFKNNSKVPSVDGETYKVKELFVNCGENTIYSPKTKKYTVRFIQKGRFVSAFDNQNQLCLGVWQNTGCDCWQLILSINKGDNDLFILTPKKMTIDNVVKEFDAVNIEAGSTPSNPKQKLGVGYMTYKRIKKNM